MVQIKRTNPGGQGLRRGPDAILNQNESNSIRNLLADLAGGWFLSPVGENIFGNYDPTGSTGMVSARFAYMPDRRRIVRPYEARCSVTTQGLAGAILKTALFLYTRSPSPQLVKLAGTDATFDVTTVGLKQTSLINPPDILPSQRLFLGYWSNDTTVVYQAWRAGPGTTVARRLQLAATSVFNPRYLISDLARVTSSTIPAVLYLSQEASTLV